MPQVKELMERTSHKLNLVRTAFFKKVGDEVYVRNVATGEEFVFNGAAAPIFAALRRGADRSSAALRGNGGFLRQLDSFGLLDSAATHLKGRKSIPKNDVCQTSSDIPGRFQEIRRKKHQLWSAGLELTYRCNERCRHCYLDVREEQTSSRELTVDEWLSVVDQLARMGCMNVLVTGGEPTLHPAFWEVCERIVKRGMLCDVYTNGLAITDGLFKSLCDLPLNSISVSLYAGDENFHDEITGVPGSFRKTLSNLLRFKDAGFDAYAKVPVFHNHLEDFFAAKELGRKHGFRVMASTLLVPGHSGTTRNPMMMDADEYMKFLEREATPRGAAVTEADIEKSRQEPLCQAGQSTCCISPFGEVMPCNSFSEVCGNVREATLSKIWRTSEFFRRLRKVRRCNVSLRCATCPDVVYCTICPGAAWNETQGQIAPCSWSCEQTHVRAAFNLKTNK